MVGDTNEVEALRQENRIMRQELHMMRTSPRAMIGFAGNDASEAPGTTSAALESPEKTVSEAAFSIDAVVKLPPDNR